MHLVLEDITKRFGSFVAVDSVSLEVGKGEFLAFLGPSGCGKTTTLNVIAGFIQPDAGSIFLTGKKINDMAIHRRGTAMVFQNYALFPHMTVFDNVAFGLVMRKVAKPEIHSRVKRALDIVRLPNAEGKYPSQLSGGQQQRAALARVLVLRPEVLLLDEPLSNLDAKLRESMRMELREIQKAVGITTIFVTHDIQEAFALADRVAVMNCGRIEQVAPPEEIYERPRTEFVASFVGESNVFEGEVVAVDRELATLRTVEGIALKIPFDEEITVGMPAKVMVRPENIHVTRVSQGEANTLCGQVVRSIYLGNSIRYGIKVNDRLILANSSSRASSRLMQGEEAVIAWKVEDNVRRCHPVGQAALVHTAK